MSVYLGVTGTDLCPVAAILSYMTLQGKNCSGQEKPAPFFRFSDGSPLTRDKLVAELRRALRAAGLDDSNFAGHSFRIGAATTAAACGLPDSLIKTLGRWESAAYTLYIKTPRELLCSVAGKLVEKKGT